MTTMLSFLYRKKTIFFNSFVLRYFPVVLSIFFTLGTNFTQAYAQTVEEIQAIKRIGKQYGYTDRQIEERIKSSGQADRNITMNNNVSTVDRNAHIDANGDTVGNVSRNNVNRRVGKNYNPDNYSIYDNIDYNGANTGSINKKNDVYGRDFFKNSNWNFAPNYNIPTPENYKLSVGDEVIIDIWGDVITNIMSSISPEGALNLPEIGPIYINGQTIKQAEANIKDYLSRIYSGINTEPQTTYIKVSLGKMRSMSVNILGEVEYPGTYTIPSLSTITGALYSAGGPANIGTVRSIKLMRKNKVAGHFDIYDFIVDGKFDQNIRLEDNDVLLIGPYENIIEITGAVKRPMKYELKDDETISDLLRYAGGFSNDANIRYVHIDRKKTDVDCDDEIAANNPVAKSFDVPANLFEKFVLMDGDIVAIMQNRDKFANRVIISGPVWYPGSYAITGDDISLLQLIESAGGLMDDVYMQKGYIMRVGCNGEKQQVTFNLTNEMNGTEKTVLMPDDSIKIFSISELEPDRSITVRGEVNRADNFEYREGMTLGDAILMAGGVNNAATLGRIEIARRIGGDNDSSAVVNKNDTIAVIFKIDLLKYPDEINTPLQPFDAVYVFKSSLYKPQQPITIQGEITYPGTYIIEKNTVRLSDIILRAGGLNADAYVQGAKLTRVLNKEEVARLQTAMSIVKRQDMKSTSIDSLEIGDRYDIAIDLAQALMNRGSYYDVVLREGDIISVPKLNNTVKISGAVLYPNTITYSSKMRLNDYISNAGGYSQGAMKKRIYMVHMNGSVSSRGSRNFKVLPGTEIVVPKRDSNKAGKITLAEVLGIASSTASIAAIVVSISQMTK